MKAIVEINSKQYIVSENMILDIDYIDSDEKALNFNNIVCLYDENSSKFGSPYIKIIKNLPFSLFVELF